MTKSTPSIYGSKFTLTFPVMWRGKNAKDLTETEAQEARTQIKSRAEAHRAKGINHIADAMERFLKRFEEARK